MADVPRSPGAFVKQLSRVGLPLEEDDYFCSFSLALGSAEVSLLNVSTAERTLAKRWTSVPCQIYRIVTQIQWIQARSPACGRRNPRLRETKSPLAGEGWGADVFSVAPIPKPPFSSLQSWPIRWLQAFTSTCEHACGIWQR